MAVDRLADQVDDRAQHAVEVERRGDRVDDLVEVAIVHHALRLDPRSIRAFVNRALAWRNKSDFGRALADYDEAIKLDRTYALAYSGRANVWNDKGDEIELLDASGKVVFTYAYGSYAPDADDKKSEG